MQSGDLRAEADRYFALYPDNPPDFFVDRRRERAREAFQPGAWGERLFGSIERPHAYSLHAEHFDLPPECADPERFCDPEIIALWKAAIRANLTGPLYWTLECGSRTHAHICAAHDAGLPEIPRGSEIVKPADEGWIAYMLKPPLEYNAKLPERSSRNLALWMRAKRRGRLPRHSGTMGIPNRRTWERESDPSRLRVYFDPAPFLQTEPIPDLSIEIAVKAEEAASDETKQHSPDSPLEPAETDRDRVFFLPDLEYRETSSGTQKPCLIQRIVFQSWDLKIFALQNAHFRAELRGAVSRFKTARAPPIQITRRTRPSHTSAPLVKQASTTQSPRRY